MFLLVIPFTHLVVMVMAKSVMVRLVAAMLRFNVHDPEHVQHRILQSKLYTACDMYSIENSQGLHLAIQRRSQILGRDRTVAATPTFNQHQIIFSIDTQRAR